MIFELFKHLSPKDLVVCSMVNKRWQSIYSNCKMDRLAAVINFRFGRISHQYEPLNWHSNRMIEEKERCQPELLAHLADKPLLSKLRHLALRGTPNQFDLNGLNRFEQLLQLEIRLLRSKERVPKGKKVNLNLLKLKVLVFVWIRTRCVLSIDCPELNHLVYYGDGVNLLDVKHPETIKWLNTNLGLRELVSFRSVECLKTDQFILIGKAILQMLPKLIDLRYDQTIVMAMKFLTEPDQLKRMLKAFLDDAAELRGFDFRFRFAGFQMTQEMVDQIDFSFLEITSLIFAELLTERVYMRNYQLIEPGDLDFIQYVHYDRLMYRLTGELPSCFAKKFTGIEEVSAGGAIEDEQLLQFLKSLRALRKLTLTSNTFNQALLDRLPSCTRSLVNLHLAQVNEVDANELQLNFDFIGKFSFPRFSLTIDQSLSFESLVSLAKQLGKLRVGDSRIQMKKLKDQDVWIFKNPKVWKVCHSEIMFKYIRTKL